MGRRTEIREGIHDLIGDCLIEIGCGDGGCPKAERLELEAQEKLLSGILNYLHSQGVVIKAERVLLPLADLEPDVDACFGQEVCCEILPKYLPNAGRVKDKCYQEIMGLAYGLANTIAKIQQEHNTKAGCVAVEPLIGDK